MDSDLLEQYSAIATLEQCRISLAAACITSQKVSPFLEEQVQLSYTDILLHFLER